MRSGIGQAARAEIDQTRPTPRSDDPVSACRTAADPVAEVLDTLRLRAERHPRCPRVSVLRTADDGTPVAAIVEQGSPFREDREAIENLKLSDRDLPIIYIAHTATPRCETAVRRLCIHYFLAEPVEKEELRLVLEVLVRSAGSTHPLPHSFERFFTR